VVTSPFAAGTLYINYWATGKGASPSEGGDDLYRGTTGESRTLDPYSTLKAVRYWQSACLPTTRTTAVGVCLPYCFFMPDVSMVGYLANAQIGAAVYNAVHTYLGPLLLGAYSVSTDHRTPLLLALIWVAHIGLDRMLGFGLKYPTEFKDTHLSARRHAYILK
jgi:hypothetical protein